MKFAKRLLLLTLCLSWLVPVSSARAVDEYYLAKGGRAEIAEGRLILIQANGRRSVARPGIYDTSDGRYSLIVKGKGVVIMENRNGQR
jgi:hypothetical protein